MVKVIRIQFIPILILSIILLCLTFMMEPMLNEASASVGTISGSVVNVRSGPGTQHQIAGTLYKDTSVEIIEKGSDWYKVQFGSLIGWVHSSLLNVKQPDITIKVGVMLANLRSGPGIEYSIVDQVSKDNVLTLVDIKDEWYKVKTLDNQVAFIRSDMIASDSQTNISTPAPTASAQPQKLKIVLDGQPISWEFMPQIENNKVLVPLRDVFEAMGVAVAWNPDSYTVYLTTSPANGINALGIEVTSDAVNLRSGPGLNNSVVDIALRGDKLPIMMEQNGWYQVYREGKSAWVASWVVNVF